MAIDKYQVLADNVKREFPRFRVTPRNKSWLRPVFALLGFITRRNYSRFITTIGSTMYVSENWDTLPSTFRYRTLRHELQHIRQFNCWPLGRALWPVNYLLTALAYLLVLPVFWTMRAHFERQGYTQTLLVDYELRGHITDRRMERNARWLAGIFGSSTYFFMWRKKAAYRWAMKTQRAINEGLITNDRDRVDELHPLGHSSPPS